MVQDAAITAGKVDWSAIMQRGLAGLRGEFTAQKDRALLWLPIFFAFGIGFYFSLSFEPSLWGGGLASLFALSLIAFFRHIGARQMTLVCGGLLLMAGGFLTAQIRTLMIDAPMLERAIGPVDLTGTIESIEALGPKEGSRLLLTDLEIEDLAPAQTPKRVRISMRKDEGIKAGDRISVLARLNPPSPPVAPHAFDFQRYFYFKQIGGLGFAYSGADFIEHKSPGIFESLRQKVIANVNENLPYPQAAVAITLLTGQKGAISDRDQAAMRASGLAHLLAISGLHVGMVAGVIFFFSRALMALFPAFALRHPIKKYAAAFAMIAAFFYMMVVGATIPTQRAMMMTGLMLAAIMLDRSPFSLRLVALAALGILIISPESLLSVSFQMSFAAVVALICFYDWLRPFWSAAHRRAGVLRRAMLYVAGVMLTTIVAGFATGLFALYHFQNYAVFGVVANVIAVPLMAFVVMPVAVLSYFLMPLGLEGISLDIMGWGIGWVLGAAHWVANMEGAVWHVPVWPQPLFVLMVLSALTFMIWKGALRYLALAAFCLSCLPVSLYKQPDIQISSDLNLILIRSDSGALWLSSGRKDRFTAESWLKMNGQEEEGRLIWPREGHAAGFPLKCGAQGCRGEINGQLVAVAFNVQAAREDCLWADVLISQEPVEKDKCPAAYIIDRFDVWRQGAYALWLDGEAVHMRTVAQARGHRPWTGTLKR